MMQGCLKLLGVLALMVLAAAGALWGFGQYVKHSTAGSDPVTIANASLQGLREQNRLSTFAARYVAVVTSEQSRLGLSARKTLIMPGMVRYEVDLSRLEQEDLEWNPETNKLSIKLPPLEVVGPQVDMNNIREYDQGGILMSLTDAEEKLDTANRKAGQAELVRQAREETPMRLAREATRRAVQRSFAMPLRAAGIQAEVEVYFPDERSSQDREPWDVSPSIGEVYANAR